MKAITTALMLSLLLMIPIAGFAANDLDSFVASLNIQAQADLPGFKARLSAEFGTPQPRVEALLAAVDRPGDAFMVLRVGQVAKQPTETVLTSYKNHRSGGWGKIAKELGIKPGSREFHALKKGSAGDDGPGKGHGKGKGKNK